MRPVTQRDQLTLVDVETAAGRHAIQSPDGQVIVPRPKPGYRFVGWLTAETADGPWQPMPRGGQAQWFVRAHYERLP